MTQAPADRILELLRAGRLDYRCHPKGLGHWTAQCPLCREMRLTVTENGRGGKVTLRCGNGCDPGAVLRKLTLPPTVCHACGIDREHHERLVAAADELLDLAWEQQGLLQGARGRGRHRSGRERRADAGRALHPLPRRSGLALRPPRAPAVWLGLD